MPPWIWIARSQARGAELGRHVGEVVLDRLELADDLPEGRALTGVVERGLVGRDAAAERRGAAQDALVVERGQELVEAAPFLAEHGIRGEADAVVEDGVRVPDGG